MDSLKQSKFRFLNEMLYTQHSKGAVELFKSPEQFEDYHEGYRQQVAKWPRNPLDVISKELCKVHKYPDFKIADFGCGEGKLQLKLEQAGHKRENLKSFDAGKLAGSEHVIQCDIASVPLPANHLDVGVFCLSLMGTNFPSFLLEANRVLKMKGLLFVAEVLSRFEDIKSFTSKFMPQVAGFKCLKQTVLEDFFYIMVFQKEVEAARFPVDETRLEEFSKQLKPCIYKRR